MSLITNKTVKINPVDDSLAVGSLDDGFGDFKFDNNGNPALIPSFVTSFKPKPTDDFSTEGNKLKYVACEVDDNRYVVGDYAMKLDSNIKWVGGENKHLDKRFPIIMKTVLGLMSKGTKGTIYTLMMNLPIKSDTPERRKMLKDIVQGTHEISISHDGVNFIPKIITVEDVNIKKQPFGSVCDLMLDNNGDIIDHDIAKGFNVVADIGARTLNVLTLEALEEQPELTTHTTDGMYTAYTSIGNYLENKLGVMIPDGKLPLVIRNREIKGMDISPVVEQAFENHANTILNVLDKILINSMGFVTNIIFTGGGAELLKSYLEGRYAHTNVKFLDRYANVRGLRKYGVRLYRKQDKKKNIQVQVGNSSYHRK